MLPFKRKKTENTVAEDTYRVSSTTNPNSLAGAIAEKLRGGDTTVKAQAIGAGSVNQLVKSIAISRGYLASSGKDIICVPGFVDAEVDGEVRTGIQFSIMLV